MPRFEVGLLVEENESQENHKQGVLKFKFKVKVKRRAGDACVCGSVTGFREVGQ